MKHPMAWIALPALMCPGFYDSYLSGFLSSHEKAIAATNAGAFQNEIVPVEIETPDGRELHTVDEGIRTNHGIHPLRRKGEEGHGLEDLDPLVHQ